MDPFATSPKRIYWMCEETEYVDFSEKVREIRAKSLTIFGMNRMGPIPKAVSG